MLWQAYIDSSSPLVEFPCLCLELVSYGLILLPCRRIERVHAEVKRHLKENTRDMVPTLSAAVRRREAEALLQDKHFRDWLAVSWRKKLFMRKAFLQTCSRGSRMRWMIRPWNSIRDAWFQCSIESQYDNHEQMRTEYTTWNAFSKPFSKALPKPISTSHNLMVRALKYTLSEPGVLWKAPVECLTAEGTTPPDAPENLMQLLDNCAMLFKEDSDDGILRLEDSEEPATVPGALPPEFTTELCLFKVVAAYPETKHTNEVAWELKRTSLIVITRCIPHGDGTTTSTARIESVDLVNF